jgi:bifunctional non-homologous end joining protein LigD
MPATRTAKKSAGRGSGAIRPKSKSGRSKVGAAAGAAKDMTQAQVMGVAISHPQKVLWPAGEGGAALTKLNLAEYYESCAPFIFEHAGGRPLSIVRAPDGIAGERFFQRHAIRDKAGFLAQVAVAGDREPYLELDRVEGLASLAQIGALELHPWNCARGRPELPGRLVFDLDPAEDVSFDQVVETALELRGRLRDVGLCPLCKTTGGKGLHVVAPLRAAGREKSDWPTAKAIAQKICSQMAADSPGKFLISMSKRERAGRIFLDYLRNDRMATAVAPLSPRVRTGAPVSMPLTWKEVRPGLQPQRYGVRNAAALLARSGAWADYSDCERSLAQARRKLS